MSSAGIVEVIAIEWRAPVVEHPDQLSRSDVIRYSVLRYVSEAEPI